MKHAFIGLLAAFLLGGCVTTGGRPGETHERIKGEMQSAVDGQRTPNADAVNQALLPPLQIDVPKAAEAVEPRFDLVVSNAPAAQVFMALVSGTRYSMLVSPELAGTVTVNLKNVSVREALETLRDIYGYDYRIQGTRISVLPNTLQTRVFQVNYLAGRRQGSSDVRVTSSSISVVSPGTSGSGSATGTAAGQPAAGAPGTPGGSTTRAADSSRVYTTQDADFWKELNTALGAIVGNEQGRGVILNAHSGVIVVRAMPNELRNVENYLRATQLIIERQVMLEAKIIEVSLSEGFQSGVNWSAFSKKTSRMTIGTVAPGTTLGTTGAIGDGNVGVVPGSDGGLATSSGGRGFFGLAFQTSNFAALLNFLETQGTVHVLSSPRIATLNNQKAVLKVGTDEYYVTNVSTTTVAGTGSTNTTTPSVTLQPFFSGIALDVTPQIDENNTITLHVHPAISVVKEKEKVINLGSQVGSMTLPLATSTVNETDSIVRVQDGNIVAIGGLMKQSQVDDRSGLPGTTGPGFFGALFGQRAKSLAKQELVILIKPTVIQNEADWQPDLRNTQSRLQDYAPAVAPQY
ncbi:secretin N-terminal domain-containing protein [Azospira sp. I13]|uniref:secretin N-terminal domain-containing protein n=1 Tax=Azospira sp. I13 TaxID=1765050 RepID=UPI000D596AD9|nr:secretin N-terminal domain-containing protein [Azospira sp. I13]